MENSVPLSQVVIGALTIAIAAATAAVVGRRRGLDQVEQRADTELRKLVEAQAARLLLLEASDRSKTERIATLEAQVRTLETELADERRITRRLQTADDGK